jgi:hypothetical protein
LDLFQIVSILLDEKMMVDDHLLMEYELMAMVVVVGEAWNEKEKLDQEREIGFYSWSNSD